ncbi:hypothetical protein RA258_000688 [Cronobacter sakazakii]|nr:hypothetical protein [Cronobacter sakazakii]
MALFPGFHTSESASQKRNVDLAAPVRSGNMAVQINSKAGRKSAAETNSVSGTAY